MDMKVNDVCISVATVNGSGSQTANLILHRSFFNMGLPVSGKNLFPSNIAGLPSWFLLRITEQGYNAPGPQTDMVVLMNPDTWDKDLASLCPGGVAIANSSLKIPVTREDITVYEVPCTSLAKEVNPKLAKMLANVVYVGAVAEVLSIPQEAIEAAIRHQFRGKDKAIEANFAAIEAGRAALRTIGKSDPYTLESRPQKEGQIIIEGNQAGALGSVFGGASFLAWYPITPSTSLAESMAGYLADLRQDKDTGEATYAIVQAEDELAAAGMVFGAGWAGARALTATSGPGIALMSEFLGLGYYAEVPGVFWDVQRVGPSTGLPTRTQQGDLLMVAQLGHGDTCHTVLIPGSAEECFEFGWRSFDVAERFQAPVFVLSDIDLGMNPWVIDRPAYPDIPMDRGKVLSKEDLDRVGDWGRYRDVDGDAIGYRTLPGTDHPAAAYFTRGSGHNEDANYTEDAATYERVMKRLKKKLDLARTELPQPVLEAQGDSSVGIIACGSVHASMKETLDVLEAEGLNASYLRVRSLPLSPEVVRFINANEVTVVVEQNRDGQLHELIRDDLPNELMHKATSFAFSDGFPLAADRIANAVLEAASRTRAEA